MVGGSAARGEFFTRDVLQALPESSGSHAQSALGGDIEYSRGHWLVRSELVWSQWNVPFATPQTSKNLSSLGTWVEGRYRITPRVVVSARADHLGFSRLDAGSNLTPTWDANVTRVEADAGYYIQRNLLARFAIQRNDRNGGRVHQRTYVSGQLSYWF